MGLLEFRNRRFEFVLVFMAFDGRGKEIRHALDEGYVVFGELPALSRVCSEDAPRFIDGADDYADAADHVVLDKQIGATEPVFSAEVVDDDWFFRDECIPGLGV